MGEEETEMIINCHYKLEDTWGLLSAQWLGLCTPNAGGLGSIPGCGTRYHMLQLKSSHAATKDSTCHNEKHPVGHNYRSHMPQLRPSAAK